MATVGLKGLITEFVKYQNLTTKVQTAKARINKNFYVYWSHGLDH